MENALLITGITVGGMMFFPLLAEFLKHNAQLILVFTLLAVVYFLVVPEYGEEILYELRQVPGMLFDIFAAY